MSKEVKHGAIPRGLFWSTVRATNKTDFEEAMKEIRRLNPEMANYLDNIDKEFWSRHAYDPKTKADHITNNMTESWNACLGDLRELPILSLLEGIRRKVMVIIAKRKAEAMKWPTNTPPIICKRLEDTLKESRSLHFLFDGERHHEVMLGTRHYIVNVEDRTCDCGGWQISGIPCEHALWCFQVSRDQTPTTFLHQIFSKDMYINTYSHVIKPIPDFRIWPLIEAEDLLPPIVMKKPGRSPTARRKQLGSPTNPRKKGALRCSRCLKFGHNKLGCPTDPTNFNKKRRRNKGSTATTSSSAVESGSDATLLFTVTRSEAMPLEEPIDVSITPPVAYSSSGVASGGGNSS